MAKDSLAFDGLKIIIEQAVVGSTTELVFHVAEYASGGNVGAISGQHKYSILWSNRQSKFEWVEQVVGRLEVEVVSC